MEPRFQPAWRRFGREMLLWLVLWLICFGLGYPTLNRYDPRAVAGLSDTIEYHSLVTDGPAAVSTHGKFRILIPLLARPFSRLAQGRLGTWEPVSFGLLVVNAFFTATTAYLLVAAGRKLFGNGTVALLGAAVYLLNFETANLRLTGLVDSAEGCFLMALAWSLLSRRFWLLPLWGVLGALGKESFVPFATVFTAVWWLVARRRELWRLGGVVATLSTGAAALVTVVVVQSIVSGYVVWPWTFAASIRGSGQLAALLANLADRNLLYGFIWLLPLGVWQSARFPRPWTLACAAAVVADLALVSYFAAQPGTAARGIFSIAGPLLSLSVASLAAQVFHANATAPSIGPLTAPAQPHV
jgi:hypothetical protein